MPIYEYVCQKCGQTTEFLEKAGAGGNHTCAACGSKRMKKAFSSFGARCSASADRSSASAQGCSSCRGGSCATCRH